MDGCNEINLSMPIETAMTLRTVLNAQLKQFDRASKSAEELAATVPPVGAANNARLEIAEKLLTQWHKYWNHTADLTTAEAVDLQNATYSFIKSSATSPVA